MSPATRSLVYAVLMSVAISAPAIAQRPTTDPTLVQTESGPVHGIAANGVISWKGIPYAAPPIGDLRWRMPQAMKPWQRELATDKFGPACRPTGAARTDAAGRASTREWPNSQPFAKPGGRREIRFSFASARTFG